MVITPQGCLRKPCEPQGLAATQEAFSLVARFQRGLVAPFDATDIHTYR